MKTALLGGFLLPAQFWVFPQFPGFSLLACAKFVPKNKHESMQPKSPMSVLSAYGNCSLNS